jgi:hypothetical protein
MSLRIAAERTNPWISFLGKQLSPIGGESEDGSTSYWELSMHVSLTIFLTVPKAHCKDLVRFGVRYEDDLIHEASLALQDLARFALRWFWRAVLLFSSLVLLTATTRLNRALTFRKVNVQRDPVLDR